MTDTYADLEIRILDLQPEGYPVELTLNDEQEFEGGFLSTDLVPWVAGPNPKDDGERLFASLFSNPALQTAWAQIRGQSSLRRIRLRIDADAPELHTIPWELLRDNSLTHSPQDLAATTATPFSRYLSGPWQQGKVIAERPIKMLVAIANPENLADYGLMPLDVPFELENLKAACNHPELKWQVLPQPCTLAALEAELKNGHHILHFIGHGQYSQRRKEAQLYLADDNNQVDLVSEDQFAAMLNRLTPQAQATPLNLIFLSSCQTATRSPADALRGLAPTLVEAGVAAVIAMQDLISVTASRTFSRTFYQRLLDDGLVDLACNEARASLLTQEMSDAAVPVLFMRTANGRLLQKQRQLRLGPVAVVQGQRIFRVRMGQRQLWAPTWLVGFISVLFVLGLGYNLATIFLGPGMMEGAFNIAVANFGQMDEAGNVGPFEGDSDLGRRLSKSVYDRIIQANPSQELGIPIEIWHDSSFWRPVIGTIEGPTAGDRTKKAEALAKSVNASIVIYGHFNHQNELSLEFFYNSPLVRAQPDTAVGQHQLGKPVALPINISDDQTLGIFSANELLGSRAQALVSLTLGLAFESLGTTKSMQRALTFFQQAEQEWPARDGKEVFYYFVGREALWLRQYELAIDALQTSIDLNSQYFYPYIALGGVYFDRAQLHFIQGIELPPELAACFPVEIANKGAETQEAAIEDHQQAMTLFEQAITLSSASDWPDSKYEAQLMFGLGQALAANIAIRLGNLDQADQALNNAKTQLEQVQMALELSKQPLHMAHVYVGLGIVEQMQAHVQIVRQNDAASIPHFEAAIAAYDQCINLDVPNLLYKEQIVGCQCQPNRKIVAAELEKYRGN